MVNFRYERKNQFAQICVTWSELLQQIWNVRTSNFSCDQKFYQDFVPSFPRAWCFDDILLCNVAWMGHSAERRIKLVIAWRGEFHKDMSFALSNMFPIAVCGRWIKSLFFADNKKKHQAKLSILGSLYKCIDQKLVCEFFLSFKWWGFDLIWGPVYFSVFWSRKIIKVSVRISKCVSL